MSEDLELPDEDNEIIELVDDGGNVINFKLLDVTEYKGVKYALLLDGKWETREQISMFSTPSTALSALTGNI